MGKLVKDLFPHRDRSDSGIEPDKIGSPSVWQHIAVKA